ncbi:MAG: ATP-binding protein [Myxococcaceae bacterium]
MNIHVAETLAQHKSEILDGWLSRIAKRPKAQSLPRETLVNNIPLILDELTRALQTNLGAMSAVIAIPRGVAESHGEDRLELGFSLSELGEEYNSLRESIMQSLDDSNVRLDNATAAALHAAVDQAHRFGVERYIELQQAQLIELQAQFIALMVHDFRGPLSSVLIGTRQLRASLSHDEKATGILDRIDRSVRRVVTLVERELSAAQALSGKLQVQHSLVDVKPVIEETLEILRPRAEAKSLALDVDVAEDCQLHTDPLLLGQVVQNLVENAIKYTASGRVRVGARKEEDTLLLSIEDTGRGIARDMLPVIFRIYNRAENISPGRGIGLTVTKSIVETLGGTVSVHSAEGAGTRFEVRIPEAASHKSVMAPSPEARQAHVEAGSVRG